MWMRTVLLVIQNIDLESQEGIFVDYEWFEMLHQ